MRRSLLQIVLAALLLAAQHGALTHQIRDLQDQLPVQSQQLDDGKQKSLSELCGFHMAFAEILGSINPAMPALRISANTAERGVSLPAFASPATSVVPASRGPPVLL